jgi:hypothetical protein
LDLNTSRVLKKSGIQRVMAPEMIGFGQAGAFCGRSKGRWEEQLHPV